VKPAARISRLCEVMDLMLDSVGDPLALETLAARRAIPRSTSTASSAS
jgi:hypothetical protein